MNFKKGEEVAIKQWNGKYRPGIFMNNAKIAGYVCVKYVSSKYVMKVKASDVIPMEVYLSPLFELMRED